LNFELNIEIHITSITKNYGIFLTDRLIMDHLWSSSVTDQSWTDFKLIAAIDEISFSVHKFMLTARSTVFASVFTKNPATSTQTEFVNGTCMKQFLVFLYTGQLVGAVCSPDLRQLATKYQLPALEQLCSLASSLETKNVSDTEDYEAPFIVVK